MNIIFCKVIRVVAVTFRVSPDLGVGDGGLAAIVGAHENVRTYEGMRDCLFAGNVDSTSDEFF